MRRNPKAFVEEEEKEEEEEEEKKKKKKKGRFRFFFFFFRDQQSYHLIISCNENRNVTTITAKQNFTVTNFYAV